MLNALLEMNVLKAPRLWVGVIGVLIVVAVVLTRRDGTVVQLEQAIAADDSTVEIDAATERRIVAFCSACHVMPPAASFDRDAWHDEVMQGYHFYAKSGRTDLDPPPPHLTIAWFRSQAREVLELPVQQDAAQKSRITFRAERMSLDRGNPARPAVANLKWLPPATGNAGQLAICDMHLGRIQGLVIDKQRSTHAARGALGHPCHSEPCDLDRDGNLDLVVADLGSFAVDDHKRGRVVWLRGDATGQWEAQPLLQGLGRVADVRPVDLDRDGDLDLVVAEFGWQRTGGILVLRNTGSSATAPKFRSERIYGLHGTIHVPCHDFDGDGLPDIVALVSQEHERIELFLNRGDKPWEVRRLWAADDPAFGSSGLELVDLDQDGDLDILFSSGDTLDSMSLKPSHGIHWLRNEGSLKFTYHRIADLSGACRVVPADFDGDGDSDLLATVQLPRQHAGSGATYVGRAVLVLFEQVSPLKFNRHTLQTERPNITTAEVGDFDGDGDVDFAVGSYLAAEEWITLWWNETPATPVNAKREQSRSKIEDRR